MIDLGPVQTNPSPSPDPTPQGTTPSSLQGQFPRYVPPPTPPATSPPPPPASQGGGTSKGLIFVLMILILALGSATALFGYQNYQLKQEIEQLQVQPTPTSVPTATPTLVEPTPTPDLTPGWKIYTNQNYGYEVKLPPDLAADERGTLDDQTLDLTYFILPERPGATASISVRSESYESILSRLETEWWGGTEESPNQVSDTTVAEASGKKITGTQVATGYSLYEVIFPRGNVTYRISLYLGPKEQEIGLTAETFDLILSTFKFLE